MSLGDNTSENRSALKKGNKWEVKKLELCEETLGRLTPADWWLKTHGRNDYQPQKDFSVSDTKSS